MGKTSLNKERYFGWAKHHNPPTPPPPPHPRGGYSPVSYSDSTFLLLVVGDLATRLGTPLLGLNGYVPLNRVWFSVLEF